MIRNDQTSGSYWDLLKQAQLHLSEEAFPEAERLFLLACERREASPGRVFFTEWQRHSETFRERFLLEGDRLVRRAVHTAELRPEDDADRNQPLLANALFLVGRSRLFSREPTSGVPLLKGLFRTARRTGRPFDVELVRPDLPLTEEDRLWLARQGGELVVAFQEQGAMPTGGQEVERWARVCLQLLNPRYFSETGRLEEERRWIEAVTADHLLGRAAESVDAYRQYLMEHPEPGERADEARVRLLELLGNIDDLHFQVPRYDEAQAAMPPGGLDAGSAMAGRYTAAVARIRYRRPDPEPGQQGSPAWASLDRQADGRLAVVFWWRDEPRDVAYWRPGEDPTALMIFLAPCEGRLIAGSVEALTAVGDAWPQPPAAWPVPDFAAALLEPFLPATGLQADSLLRLAMGETAAWRSGWNPDHGHQHLEPPRHSHLAEAWHGGPAGGALVAGLLVLAMRSRLAQADPCLRAGIGHLARRGDPAAAALYGVLAAGSAEANAVDGAFQPWTLPLLWTRPDPFGWGAEGRRPAEGDALGGEGMARPDLGRNDLAIVATGDPAGVVAAWGDGREKWRIVLDRLDRLEGLSRVAGGAIGPVTLIPRDGSVHALDGALEWLEQLLTGTAGQDSLAGLLPLFHWVRLVESHNGDLLDFREVRPRPGADPPLYTRYAEAVAHLPREEPHLEDTTAGGESWATQFSQRVRRAGFVAGMVDSLLGDAERLDSLWGVFEGSEASWVFLDSAAVHWSLLGRQGAAIHDLHSLLHSRGRRHLSLLTGAVWLRSELEGLLATWLQVYGTPYRVVLTDSRPPRLKLADRGWIPDAVSSPVSALAGALAHVRRRLDGGEGGTLLLPAEGSGALFWRDMAAGGLGEVPRNLFFLGSERAAPGEGRRLEEIPAEGRRVLMIPVLGSLEGGQIPIALEDSPAAWAQADRDRHEFLEWRRRMCGLELAAHLAGSWDEVEILDARWWRLLKPRQADPSATVPWTGALAAGEVAPETVGTFDLPGSGSSQQCSRGVLEAVRQWVTEHPGETPSVPVTSDAAKLPQAGSPVLVTGSADLYWRQLVAQVQGEWEQGDVSSWILVVAKELPGAGEGASMVAGSWVPGMSAWPTQDDPADPAPLLWLQREDFANPELVEFLKRKPPTWIMVCGLEGWLPDPAAGKQVAARALRVLLDQTSAGIVLQSQGLPGPWWAYLRQATGAECPAAHGVLGESITDFPGDGEALERLRQLLLRLEEVLPCVPLPAGKEGQGTVSARQLISLRWLAMLAGTPEETIRHGVRILRWAGRLAGDSLSAAAGQLENPTYTRVTHALIIPERFAELEHRLLRLQEQLSVLLPLWLDARRPGLPTWVDLAYPPAETEAEDLLRLDAYLGMVAGAPEARLGWEARRGFMHAGRRLLSCRGPANEVLEELARGLEVFRRRVQDLMSGAVETGDGFLVDTGLTDLGPGEKRFLGTGAALGLWRWLGPVDQDSLHLVDLLTLAESPTVRREDLAWNLLRGLVGAGPGDEVGGEAESAAGSGRGGWTRGVWRQFWKGPARTDPSRQAAGQVANLVRADGKRGILILRGALGSGRHAALGRGLEAFLRRGEITVFCPDEQAAAVLLEAVGPRTAALLADIRIPEPGETPPVPLDLPGHLADTGDNRHGHHGILGKPFPDHPARQRGGGPGTQRAPCSGSMGGRGGAAAREAGAHPFDRPRGQG